jgi:hypothetical protein
MGKSGDVGTTWSRAQFYALLCVGPLAGATFAFCLTCFASLLQGFSGISAVLIGVAYASSIFCVTFGGLRGTYSRRYHGKRFQRLLAGGAAANSAALLVLVGFLNRDLSVLWPAVVGVLVFPFTYRFVRDSTGKLIERRMGVLAELAAPEQANDMIESCRRALKRAGLDGSGRAAASTNLAQALATRSLLSGQPDGLVESTAILSELVIKGEGDPGLLFRAAQELVDAMDLKADKHGDTYGWREAVSLLRRTARAFGEASEEMGLAERYHGDFYAFLADQAADESESTIYMRLSADAYRESIRLFGDNGLEAASSQLSLCRLFDSETSSDVELDQAADLCRDTVRRLQSERSFRDSAYPEVTLMSLLVRRARRDPTRVWEDTAEVVEIARRVLANKRKPPGEAAYALASALLIREDLGLSGEDGSGKAGIGIGEAFRLAFDQRSRIARFHASEVASDWADWAISRDAVEEAAESLWRLVMIVPAEALRQFDRVGREYVVGASQGAAAEAGYWLARAGRLWDAALAVEYGRAVLFSGAARYAPLDLHENLSRAGRGDLWVQWLQAAANVEDNHRKEYGQREEGGGAIRLRRVGETHRIFTSSRQEAWSTFNRLSHEVAVVVGQPTTSLPPSFSQLRENLPDGLSIYVFAASKGGSALVLDGYGDPVSISLPGLDSDRLFEEVERYMEAQADASVLWPSFLLETLEWLSEVLAKPLLPVLDSVSSATVIPVGMLGLLPLHAVLSGDWRNDGEPRHGDTVIRYAPNLRIAAGSGRTARRMAGSPCTVLAADAPNVAGMRDLPKSPGETDFVGRTYGSLCRRLPAARRTDVLGLLKEFSVWHFACHGIADIASPLDSALILTDGPITLREIFEMQPGEYRLAVLSACQTSVPDTDLLDETISFPGALLHAGVAGVVSSQWDVDDVAAALTMRRFHQLLSAGAAPAEALAESQRWLRSVTNSSLSREHPDLVPAETGLPGPGASRWERKKPFRHPQYWAAFTYFGS